MVSFAAITYPITRGGAAVDGGWHPGAIALASPFLSIFLTEESASLRNTIGNVKNAVLISQGVSLITEEGLRSRSGVESHILAVE